LEGPEAAPERYQIGDLVPDPGNPYDIEDDPPTWANTAGRLMLARD